MFSILVVYQKTTKSSRRCYNIANIISWGVFMKRCLVISMGTTTGETIAEQVRELVGSQVHIDKKQMSDITRSGETEITGYDIVLFTSVYVYKIFIQDVKVDVPNLIAGRVIDHKNIAHLISLPAGSEILLINDSKLSAIEAIDQLIELGLDHIQYHPYYPGTKNYKKLATAITPGEPQLMPDCVETIIDIGTRILDIKSMYLIQDILNLDRGINDSLVIEYIKDIIKITKTIDKSRRAEKESRQVLETIFDSVDNGIAYLDQDQKIIKINSKLQYILGKNKRDILNKQVHKVFEELEIRGDKSLSKKILISGEYYLVDVEKMSESGLLGYLVMVYPMEKIQEMGQSVYKAADYSMLTSLHSFEDYLTVHPKNKKMLQRAERFSKTDATIAIQGENGTGKEIIAQGIHRHSFRRNKPFIPVNIAAISQNLLESELFGYEKGSFTGASKEGKIGLFEVANGGTLFIDEIGDAPLDIQVKLLRVLQEKKIRRIGATEEVSVDVRVITATNKDLLSLVDEGIFREDLYFRLNTLPIRTLPLRRRREDISHFLLHFSNVYFNSVEVTDLGLLFEESTIEFLKNYKWRGNVRELINLVEYLSHIYDGLKFTIEDLPEYFLEQSSIARRLDDDELWMLSMIDQYTGVGRVILTKQAKQQNRKLGEGQIRRLLTNLTDEGYVKLSEEGRGVVLSYKGEQLLLKQ